MANKTVHTSKLVCSQIVQQLGRADTVAFQAAQGDKLFDKADDAAGSFAINTPNASLFKVGKTYDMTFAETGDAPLPE